MKKLVLTLIFALFSPSIYAFSNYAHELICDVAYDLLSDDAQDFVDDLMERSNVASNSDTFGEACIWADEVRRTSHQETYDYHFINVPKDEDLDFDRDCAAFDCVSQAIIRYAINLSSPRTRTRDRKEALLFLGHFVGDLHQPLHVGNVEDLGGNAFDVFTSATDQNANTSLHSIWDNNMGRRAQLHRSNARGTIFGEINSTDTSSWETTSVSGWARDAHNLARSDVYLMPDGTIIENGTRLTDEYYDNGAPIIKDQVMKASVRLAMLIELAAAGGIEFDTLN